MKSAALQSISQKDRELFLKKALEFMQVARETILRFVERGFGIETKGDQTLVTEADKAVEQLFVSLIQKHFPEHDILGEEFGGSARKSSFQWITDPIDGTQNFAHGVPTYGTILGLFFEGEPLVGVVDHPALDRRYWAAKDLGAFCNGKQLKIHDSGAGLTRQEIVVLSTHSVFARSNETALFENFMRLHPSTRIYYDVFGHTQAAEGNIGAMVEFNMRIWDLAATQILIEEAGGKYLHLREVSIDSCARFSSIFGKPSVVDALEPFFQVSATP